MKRVAACLCLGICILWSMHGYTAEEPRPSLVKAVNILIIGKNYHQASLWQNPISYRYETRGRYKIIDDKKTKLRRYRNRTDCSTVDTSSGAECPTVRLLPDLARVISLVVIHADSSQSSQAFWDATKEGGDATHFFIDYDGAIYQTLDLMYAAAGNNTIDNRAIHIHLNNPLTDLLKEKADAPSDGKAQRPRERSEVVAINGQERQSYGYTEVQYNSLALLLKCLVESFPLIGADSPRDNSGRVRLSVLSEAEMLQFRGIVGAYHLDSNSWNPGPGFNWDKVHALLKNPPDSSSLKR